MKIWNKNQITGTVTSASEHRTFERSVSAKNKTELLYCRWNYKHVSTAAKLKVVGCEKCIANGTIINNTKKVSWYI